MIIRGLSSRGSLSARIIDFSGGSFFMLPLLILSIDPGITTGYALQISLGDGPLALCLAGNLSPEDIDCLRVFSHKEGSLQVVIEETPIPTTGRMNRVLKQVVTQINSYFPEAIRVSPSTWKSMYKARRYLVLSKGKSSSFSPHMKDAIRMGVWADSFIRKEKSI